MFQRELKAVLFTVFLASLLVNCHAEERDIQDFQALSENRWESFVGYKVVIAKAPNERKLAAFSAIASSEWTVYESKNRCRLEPFLQDQYIHYDMLPVGTEIVTRSAPLVALKVIPSDGDLVESIAVFNGHSGEWVEQKLIEPSQEEVLPFLDGIVHYHIGNRYYAFSPTTSRPGGFSKEILQEVVDARLIQAAVLDLIPSMNCIP